MKQKPYGVVYEILFPSGKRYIGQTTNPSKRINNYKNHDCEEQRLLYKALCKYGWDNCVFSILYNCRDMDELNLLEEVSIAQYKSNSREFGYNLQSGGYNKLHTQETKDKIGLAQKGKINRPESILKISQSLKEGFASGRLVAHNTGVPMTEGAKENLRQKKLGTKHTEETKRKISECSKGKPNFASRDSQIYSFENVDKQLKYIGTQREFTLLYSLNRKHVNQVVRGTCKSCKGWKLENAASQSS